MFNLPRTVRLTGVLYNNAQENIKEWGCKYIGTYELVREPYNPHDPNAIKVAVIGQVFLGYVPRQLASLLAPMIDNAGRKFVAEFVSVNKHPRHEVVGLTVKIIEVKPHAVEAEDPQKGGAEHGA